MRSLYPHEGKKEMPIDFPTEKYPRMFFFPMRVWDKGEEKPVPPYDIIVYKEGDEVRAENRKGQKIASGRAGSADGEVIQKGINEAAQYSLVYLNGEFNLERGIILPSFISISGGKLTAKDNANLDYLLKISGGIKFINIYDITIDGNKSNGNPNIAGILVEAETPNKASGWSKVALSRIINCNKGIYLKGYSDSIWERVWHFQISTNWFGGNDGPNDYNIYGNLAHAVVVTGNALEDATTGIYLKQCRGWAITSNWFDDHTDYGICLDEVSSEYYCFVTIANNYFTDSGIQNACIFIGYCSVNNLIINNEFNYVKKYAIHIKGRRNHVLNNIINMAGGDTAIRCEYDGKLNIISNNFLLAGNTGIYVSSSPTYSLITGNKFDTCSIGIYFRGSHTVIENNHFFAVTTPMDVVNSEGIVRRNFGYCTENSGTATFSGDGTTTQFSIAHGLVSEPSKVLVTPMTEDAAGDFYVTKDATNIYVNYLSAPPSGSNNVKLSWYAEV